MSLSRDEVLHIAHLARVAVGDQDVARFQEQLSDILAQFETLQALDTEGVEPTSHPLPLESVMREDTARPSLDSAEALQNAPIAEEGLFRVRAVLE